MQRDAGELVAAWLYWGCGCTIDHTSALMDRTIYGASILVAWRTF
jgi:hypothetical protein